MPVHIVFVFTTLYYTVRAYTLPHKLGSGVQEWHTDDSMTQPKKHRYFTILINLNPLDAYCGGTEVWIDKLKRGDLVSTVLVVYCTYVCNCITEKITLIYC